MNRIGGFLEILPIHAFFSSEGCFMYFPVGWCCRDTTKIYLGKPESIGRAKHGTNVIQAAHVIQYDHEREFFSVFILFRGESVQFFIEEFTRHVN